MRRQFRKGPPLSAQFHFANGALSHITLEPSDTFSCELPKSASQWISWLEAYSEKEPYLAEIPWDTCKLSLFQKKALQQLQKIPLGEVISYGELAERIGHKDAARAVGTACRVNPFPLLVPCHRVVAANGLGGFAYGTALKQHLLDFERL